MLTIRTTANLSILVGLVLSTIAPAHADPGVYQAVVGSAAWIINSDEQATGSGVLIDLESRLVVTNYHVVGKSKNVVVFFSAYDESNELVTERKTYTSNFEALREQKIAAVGKVVARWSIKDLALVQLDRLPAEAQAIPLAEESPLPGERVHTVGNSGKSGALWVYSPGRVRQIYRRQHQLGGNQKVDARIVETTSPTNGGDSGAPLVNDNSELIGLMSSHSSAIIEKEVGTASNGRAQQLRLYRYREGARLVTQAIDSQEIRKLLTWYYDNVHDPYEVDTAK